MNEVAQTAAADPWGAYAEATASKNNGDYLYFKKGFWEYGQDKKEMDHGTVLIFNMDELKTGWQRWKDKKPADEKFIRVVTGLAPATRDTLGFTDETEWADKTDSAGKVETKDGVVLKQDPWQKVSSVPCVDLDGKQYTFTTGSVGGMQALGKLCGAYGKECREHPEDHPKIKIGKDHYMSDGYGKVFFPTFEIIGWIDKNEGSDTSNETAAAAQVEDKSTQAAAAAVGDEEF